MNNPNKLLESGQVNYNYLVFVAMLFITLKLLITVLVYHTVAVFNYTASVSIILMPIWFLMMDVLTEIYGFQITRKLVIWSLVCQFIFAFGCDLVTKLPVITNKESLTIFQMLPRIAIASLVAGFMGGIINSYLVEKYKLIFSGEYFVIRIFCASMIGELVYTIVADVIAFIYIRPFPIILQLIFTSYLIKIIAMPIMLIPAVLFSKLLSKLENSNFASL